MACRKTTGAPGQDRGRSSGPMMRVAFILLRLPDLRRDNVGATALFLHRCILCGLLASDRGEFLPCLSMPANAQSCNTRDIKRI